MRIINLTPHAIGLATEDGVVTIPASGTVARVAVSVSPAGEIETDYGRVPLVRLTYGDPVGLPDPQDGVVYIVSKVVADALPDRPDLVYPDTSPESAIRNDAGQIVAVRRLVTR